MPPIPIIDLFAGPGGLGEGFSAFRPNGRNRFKIGLSIETNRYAHSTLELRAFYRYLAATPPVPPEYYSYIAGAGISREKLFDTFPAAAKAAREEAWQAQLGKGGVAPEDVDNRIRKALAGRPNWLLIGGPPCQAYSLVGRSKIIGGKDGLKKYEEDHRHFLYKEYLRIIAEHRPPVFVMENVKGLLSAKVKNEDMMSRILGDLQHPLEAHFGPGAHRRHGRLSYKLVSLTVPPSDEPGDFDPADFIVRSEEYGIPQARHRLIILGVADNAATPGLLQPSPKVPIEDAISDLPRLRSGLSKETDSPEAWRDAILTIRNASWMRDSKLDDRVRREILAQLRAVDADFDRGAEWMHPSRRLLRAHRDWFADDQLTGVCNHVARIHIREDLHRYFFASCFAIAIGRSPLLEDFPRKLLPDHENVDEALKGSKFNDRFRVQYAGRPSTTVTSHIHKDGHYFIHYEPFQCRSLTVREAARLQTFPDNYFFEGPRTQQYHQVGNAVPPLLAHQIAAVVADLFP